LELTPLRDALAVIPLGHPEAGKPLVLPGDDEVAARVRGDDGGKLG